MKKEILYRGITKNVNGLSEYTAYSVYGSLETTGVEEHPLSIAGCFVDEETVEQLEVTVIKKITDFILNYPIEQHLHQQNLCPECYKKINGNNNYKIFGDRPQFKATCTKCGLCFSSN